MTIGHYKDDPLYQAFSEYTITALGKHLKEL